MKRLPCTYSVDGYVSFMTERLGFMIQGNEFPHSDIPDEVQAETLAANPEIKPTDQDSECNHECESGSERRDGEEPSMFSF